LPVTFGVGKSEKIERVTIDWPSGRSEEYKNLASGKVHDITESKGVTK
jgi:enediyne biosynthesis protein E4